MPPSQDVQEAEQREAHEKRVKRAKAKLYSTWWGLGFFFYAVLAVLYMVEWYWLMPATCMFPIWLMIRSNTSAADLTYQEGVSVGLSLGSKAALDGYQHVMGHIKAGEEPCEDAYKLSVKIPHVWEHEFVYAEMQAIAEPVVSQDTFNEFMRDIGVPTKIQDRVNEQVWGSIPTRDDDEEESEPEPRPLPNPRKVRRLMRKLRIPKDAQEAVMRDLDAAREALEDDDDRPRS